MNTINKLFLAAALFVCAQGVQATSEVSEKMLEESRQVEEEKLKRASECRDTCIRLCRVAMEVVTVLPEEELLVSSEELLRHYALRLSKCNARYESQWYAANSGIFYEHDDCDCF